MREFLIKKLFFYFILFVFNYLVIELLAYGLYRVKYGDYELEALQIERVQAISDIKKGAVYESKFTGSDEVVVSEVLHPYAGYVIEGIKPIPDCDFDDKERCFARVKMPTDQPFPKRSDDKLIVAILGGSVAAGTVHGTIPNYYERLLARVPQFKGREVILYKMAAGGYRQPQQLMLLNYYLSLGAELDLVINLDGFNDIAIPVSEYKRGKLHPSYPRGWDFRVADSVSPELIDLYADKKGLQRSLSRWARIVAKPWLRASPSANLLWKINSQNLLGAISEVDQQLNNLSEATETNRDLRYEEVGPHYQFTEWEDLFQYSVDMWAVSSHLTAAAAEANGAQYFQFLQPNQYVEGSKPMFDYEKEVAFMAVGGYGHIYKRAYPRIVAKTPWLTERGVNYTDLSDLYKNIEGPIYIDNCCHVNSQGSAMIVEKIVEVIAQAQNELDANEP